MAITLRLTKGSELTFQELDNNFTDLNGRVSTLETSDANDISLTSLSVTTASAGTAGLSYNNTTGVFTYTPPDLSSYLTSVPAQSFASLTGKPTTIAGYGITDALELGTSSTTALAGDTALFDGAFASLTSKPTTIAGYGITDALALGTSSTTALAGDTALFSGAFADLTSKPTTIAGYGITDAANTSAETTFTADVKFDTGVEEKFATLTGSTGVTTMDCANGHIHYLTTPAGDITANFTNLGLTAEYATNLTVIINQGVTPYEVAAVQIGGAAQTIEWQGGSAPTGNANGIDSFSFTILNDGGTYVVLGQMVDFT